VSYYKETRRPSLSDKSFVKKKSDTEKTMCATCGHPFKHGQRVHWNTKFDPRRYDERGRPISVGVCKNCLRDATHRDMFEQDRMRSGSPPKYQPEPEEW